MKFKDGLVLREVGGQAVVIATGDASKTFHGMIKLNKTAMEIWTWIEEGLDTDEIALRLCEKYSIDPADADADVKEFTASMEKAGFLEL